MLRGVDFVFIGLQPWDIPLGSTAKNVAVEVARNNRVLFVNPPLSRKAWFLHRLDPRVRMRMEVVEGKRDCLEQYSENLWVLTPRRVAESVGFVAHHGLYRWFNRHNDSRLAKEIAYAARRLGFGRYILLNDNSMLSGFYLKEMLKPLLYLYLLRDNVIALGYHRRHGSRMQPELVAKSDLVFANSGYFADYCRRYNPKTFMIGQGCDVSLFADEDGTLAVAPELKPIHRPIVGYTGALAAHRLDIELLLHTAISRPQWSLVLVGPEDDTFRASRLHALPNVHFTTAQPIERIPSFVKGFDVAINPQRINEVTSWNYPLKIDEYLALGKPVVATRTAFMGYFGSWVRLASTPHEFVEQLEMAIEEDTPELQRARIAYAHTHTWEIFVGKIYEQIESVVKQM